MTKFRKLTAYELPIANTLVWIKTVEGDLFFGYRDCKELDNTQDFIRDRCWYANTKHTLLYAEDGKVKFHYILSDFHVDSWAYVEVPT